MKKLSVFEKISLIISHPHKFFEKIREDSILDVFKFYFVFVFASCVINTLFLLPGITKDQLNISLAMYIFFVAVLIIFVLLLALSVSALSFVLYWIFHKIIRIFNGKGKFHETYKLLYAAAPLLIVSLIPYYGTFKIIFWPLFIIAGLDAGYIELIGMQKLHKMHRINALAVVFIAALLGVLALLFFIGKGLVSL